MVLPTSNCFAPNTFWSFKCLKKKRHRHHKEPGHQNLKLYLSKSAASWRIRGLTALVQPVDSEDVDVGHLLPLSDRHRRVPDGRDGFLSIHLSEGRPTFKRKTR